MAIAQPTVLYQAWTKENGPAESLQKLYSDEIKLKIRKDKK